MTTDKKNALDVRVSQAAGAASEERGATNEVPVAAVGPERLAVPSDTGVGHVPLYVQGPWAEGSDTLTHAVIMIHGRLRNADVYFKQAQQICASAGADDSTLLLVPQYLARADVDAHGLDASMLYWEWTSWMGGGNAEGPWPVSAFEVLDALLRELAQPGRFPALKTVVVAGHSGGGQVVQRYAVLARAERDVIAQGRTVRYVVANPSSYVYFDGLRPVPDSAEFALVDTQACPGYNAWKYGLEKLPAYGLDDAGQVPSAQALATAYLERDVTVLLGGRDSDPQHPALDRSCSAATQGESRLVRGRNYERYLRHRLGGAPLAHGFHEVEGVAHDALGVFGSPAGRRALFD